MTNKIAYIYIPKKVDSDESVVTVPMGNGKYWYITKGVVVRVPIKIAEKLKEMNCIQDYKVI